MDLQEEGGGQLIQQCRIVTIVTVQLLPRSSQEFGRVSAGFYHPSRKEDKTALC